MPLEKIKNKKIFIHLFGEFFFLLTSNEKKIITDVAKQRERERKKEVRFLLDSVYVCFVLFSQPSAPHLTGPIPLSLSATSLRRPPPTDRKLPLW